MIRRWRRHRHPMPAEMNITAFMNLMVVLVPILLMTAVFSRLAIIELAMPDDSALQVEQQKPEMPLTITVRQDRFEVGFHGKIIRSIVKHQQQYDLSSLSALLEKIKLDEPALRQVTILLEPDVPYEVLIQVMDTARSHRSQLRDHLTVDDLFPDISIGDAGLDAKIHDIQ